MTLAPAGEFNVYSLREPIGVATLIEHPAIAMVSFTGSTATGREIGRAALADFKKVTLELSGKSPVIVLADDDLDRAIPGAAAAIFSSSGQVCVAGSRLYVEDAVYDEVVQGIADEAAKWIVGPAHDPDTRMGPLISEPHLERVLGAVESGRRAGAGRRRRVAHPAGRGATTWSRPCSLTSTRGMDVVREEIFGPVLVANRAEGMQRCVALGNDTRYGLAASIWTENVGKIQRLAAAVRAGLVWINCHGIPDMAIPFGGYKQSGWGRENGLEGLLGYTELKSVVCRL